MVLDNLRYQTPQCQIHWSALEQSMLLRFSCC